MTTFWKWAAGSMFGMLMLIVGAFVGDLASTYKFAALDVKLDDHLSLTGHPVMEQRVLDFKESNDRAHEDLKGILSAMVVKEESQSRVLREIEHMILNGNKK